MTQNKLTADVDPHRLARAISGYNLIGGELVEARSGNRFPVTNPATGREIGHAAQSDASDVDRAASAAARAQPAWAAMTARKRGTLLADCSRLIAEHVEELGRLVALETGKALRTESRVEASVVADALQFYGGLASELKGETVPFSPDMLTLTQREPIGVVGVIIPWNAPMMLMALKIAPALVAGNTVVVKSAEEAPLAVLRLCQILSQALPAGVLNIVSGFGPECGAPLVAHPAVGKVTFTGSVETGRIVARTAGEKLIPVTLELGGKSPMIVMDDADIAKAVAGAVSGMRFTRQGQSCTAASRIFVHDKVRLVLGVRGDKFSSIDGAVYSPRAALLIKPTADSTLRFSYNRAFRATSAINNNLNTVVTNALPLGLINPAYGAAIYRVPTTAVGNLDLNEERMDAFEVGYSAAINHRVILSAAYYYTKLKDEIFFTQTSAWGASPAPPGFPGLGPFPGAAIWAQFYAAAPQIRFPKEFTYLNLGEVKNQGIELGVDASLTSTTSAYVNYSWQKDPVPNFDISELNLAPNNRFSTGVTYSGGRLLGTASLSYAGEAFWQDILDARFVGRTRAQTTINGSIGAKWQGGRYTTTLKVINLTDRQVLQHVFSDVGRRQIVGELRVNLPKK